MSELDLTVYRTTHPDALTAWHKAMDAHEKWGEQMKAFLTQHGFGKRRVYILRSGHVRGIEYIHGEDVPEGWRIDSRTGHLMPRLAARAGKDIDAHLVRLRQPDPRDAMPGMPSECFVGFAMPMCGLALIDGALYADWSLPIPESEVDLTVWERVKLSEYFRVLEEQQEQAGAVSQP